MNIYQIKAKYLNNALLLIYVKKAGRRFTRRILNNGQPPTQN